MKSNIGSAKHCQTKTNVLYNLQKMLVGRDNGLFLKRFLAREDQAAHHTKAL